MSKNIRILALAAALLALVPTSLHAGNGGSKLSSEQQQRQLIEVLQSGAPPADKAMACKKLALCGTKNAIPALANLLSDPELASWARIALEAIPGPAPDEALRRAMGKLYGKLLVGVINSSGNRRDINAVGILVKNLQSDDADVLSAAAWALGRIGGAKAAKALVQCLDNAAEPVRPAVADGCILCAEGFLNEGRPAEAVKLYDVVRNSSLPKHKVLEATRGAILARQKDGVPLLLEQLRSDDVALFGIGLRTARELPGSAVTKALAAELDRTPADRQPFLLLALADREDAAALPAILAAARTGSSNLRITAVSVLERLGDSSSVPVLLEAATDEDAKLAATAAGALARLPGADVDAEVVTRLPESSGKTRQVLIQLARQRGIEKALPAIARCAEDADAGVRAAAVETMGALGDDQQAGELVRLLYKTNNSKEQAGIEAALIAISGRKGSGCVPGLLLPAQSADPAVRIIALHALSSAGGPAALAAVKAALDDKDETVQDEAVRTLSTWPNNWPEDNGVAEPLLALAESDKKASYQILGLRGYLQYVEGNKGLSEEDKAGKVKAALPLLKRPEEKRQAITILGASPTADAFEVLAGFIAQPDVREDACSTVVKLAAKTHSGASEPQRQKALQAVIEDSQDGDTKKKAREMVAPIKLP